MEANTGKFIKTGPVAFSVEAIKRWTFEEFVTHEAYWDKIIGRAKMAEVYELVTGKKVAPVAAPAAQVTPAPAVKIDAKKPEEKKDTGK